jgi:hypothetical protein
MLTGTMLVLTTFLVVFLAVETRYLESNLFI